jgi:hypothetical protein
MADTDLQTDAQDDEQDFSIPGSDEGGESAQANMTQGAPQGAPQPVQATQPAPAAQTASSAPQVSGRAGFLGNLLKTVLQGIQNAPGNPNNAFDRGYMANSPNAQAKQKADQQLKQAQVQTAQSEADQAKIQTSITGMKALQTEYMLKRLPQEDQMKHMEVVSQFKQNLIKEGASVEAEADDEKAADAQAMHLNGTDSRSTSHAGHFWSLPSMDEDGKPKFDVVYVPTKDALQNDFTWKGADGEEHTITAGTPMLGLPKMVEQLQKDVQGDTKEQHKQMGDALKPNVPDGEIPQTVGWLANQKKQNTPLYQQNKNAVDAQINMLNAARGQINSDKIAQAHAGREDAASIKDAESDKKGAKAGDDALNYANNYLSSGNFTGSGDEALLEKFFELAKPSSGFRMSQPQIDMLKQGRGWVDAAKAKAGYIEGGKLFSDNQRQQIAGTMKMLAQSKGGGKSQQTPQRPQGVPAQAVWNPESRQWRLPQ